MSGMFTGFVAALVEGPIDLVSCLCNYPIFISISGL